MRRYVIDAHIHMDMYEIDQRSKILNELEQNDVTALVSVSNNLESSVRQLNLAKTDDRIKPAIGYHPEQVLPTEQEALSILRLIDDHAESLTAIGEVGLLYYLRRERPGLDLAPYVHLLECFIRKAGQLDLPIALHAVYEDAEIVCELLEKYSVSRAHFHWFKGEDRVLHRIISNGYMISVTPEVVYRPKIQQLVESVPLSQLMVETDGPWPFEEMFKGKLTHPSMVHESMKSIAVIKGIDLEEVYEEIYTRTQEFYRL